MSTVSYILAGTRVSRGIKATRNLKARISKHPLLMGVFPIQSSFLRVQPPRSICNLRDSAPSPARNSAHRPTNGEKAAIRDQGEDGSLIAQAQVSGYTMLTFCVSVTHLREKAMAPHSSTLAWKIPWMEEPGRLQSMGSLSRT